ncbi:hypothetical protein ACIRU8_42805 [Streptomyces sp. NPDC101175]|uniref:hypothetical protein n=1 Tax=Streptomyces sp. NPDC101175 TaxID=3366123 RepID=UPI003835BA9A
MIKQDTAQPRDQVAERAARALDRCVLGPAEIPEGMRAFMEDLVATLLRAGLDLCDVTDGLPEEAGVMLAPTGGPAGAAVRVIWHQHRFADPLGETWRTEQAAMYARLRAVLAAQGYWMGRDDGNAPTVFGSRRPSFWA